MLAHAWSMMRRDSCATSPSPSAAHSSPTVWTLSAARLIYCSAHPLHPLLGTSAAQLIRCSLIRWLAHPLALLGSSAALHIAADPLRICVRRVGGESARAQRRTRCGHALCRERVSARLQGARASKARSEAARCDHVLDPSPDSRGGSGGGLIGADSPLALCAAVPPG